MYINMKKIIFILSFFLVFLFQVLKSQSYSSDTSLHVSVIKDDLFELPTQISDSSFEKTIWSKFRRYIPDLKYVGLQIWISEKGIPIKVSFWGDGKKLKLNAKNKNILRAYILNYLRWEPAYLKLKNGEKKFIKHDVLISFEDVS